MCSRLPDNIAFFLSEEGIRFSMETRGNFRVIRCILSSGIMYVIPLSICCRTIQSAIIRGEELERLVDGELCGCKYVIVPEDFWNLHPYLLRARLLAQLGKFRPVFARNTQVKKINKPECSAFLNAYHSYGDAMARYRYGLFAGDGTMVASATFSKARTWTKPEGTVRSYEWVRYASLPDVRVIGGMGKVLKAFVNDVSPDDVMSYADREWTDGSVYARLGFLRDGQREPVAFSISEQDWKRHPLKNDGNIIQGMDDVLYHVNLGSVKYRLKLYGKQ